VLQVEVQQKAMMVRHRAANSLAQFRTRSLDPPIREGGELDRIGLAHDQSPDDRARSCSVITESPLMLAPSSVFYTLWIWRACCRPSCLRVRNNSRDSWIS
jgi:hypothetical protein